MARTPIVVCVTGAAGQIAYSLLLPIAKGEVFGADQPVILNMLDIPPMMEVLQGVVMELEDCSLPLLTGVNACTDPLIAFKDAQAVFLVGAMPRRQGMERKDLLAANAKIFEVQGAALDQVAQKSVKVLVVGNPANTNCLVTKLKAPSIPAKNFSALTRLDHNRAIGQVSTKANVPADSVKNLIIWGNHSNTQFPDLQHATINGKNAKDVIGDDDWVKNTFVPTVQQRGAKVIAARKLSSALSAAKAICDHMRDWWFGTKDDEWTSMGIVSDGSYGIDAGLVFSYPVTISKSGEWAIKQGLDIDDYARAMLDKTQEELREERDTATKLLSSE